MTQKKPEKNLLTIVGLHERRAIDQLLEYGHREFASKEYDGLILTGTGNTLQPIRHLNGFVSNELRYMSDYFNLHEVPVDHAVRSLTLLGNIRQVLRAYRHQPVNVTFAVDQSQVYRAEELILPYFAECYPHFPPAEVIAPERSFRKEAYKAHASRMDRIIYQKGLSNPLTRKLVEYALGTNNPFLEFLTEKKNRKLLKKERESQLGAVHSDSNF